ncbi:glutamate synthase subunit beta [Subsaximicrobium wynnwilliamsii]|uniref:Glutamate synthase subunit beta n=1 Tax=Subsaximicrobium wynnwilliamsii TaxID=291179 RepID=A0A5C6ZMZ4_9FLAO|nr:glutamate synthase subunit beta [Subsaximicrobium wynnwilliamsii]TXD85457.1 glutamate synthase subunit beta [Subsaximicrobium wynnwilliamsii]TXD90810.1 glutamate synthase subunit beta [Subsaximicrobium wynnwilliamsii]TXE05317.1 glutamate synthase subunit beta [Subsaximicrobium wynnwilliamsii]
MGKVTGFLEYEREDEPYVKVETRVKNYQEFTIPLEEKAMKDQGARCMDCGIPFCHSGCPLGNLIPDFNDKVYKGRWKEAAQILHATNNFPEFTGRLCPAPCEEACVLGINEDPVSIENIEKIIAERAFEEGWITAHPPKIRTDKKVAVIGSGPSGLAAAQQLNRAGHEVTVFERDSKVGGLLRYGIPDFKMEKKVIDRRLAILEEEGIHFKTNAEVGKNISVETIKADFDAVVLCGGATVRRNIPIKGNHLKGVYQAMDFLKPNNQYVDGLLELKDIVSAKDKNVIVIGGGDTGSDCIGTSNRHGAKSVTNFEILSKPSEGRPAHQPWPYWPMRLKTTSSHQEGVERFFSVSTKEFIGDKNGNLVALKTVEVEWILKQGERPELRELEGTEKQWECDMVLLALGFTGAEKTLADQFGLEMDFRTNIKATIKDYATNVKGVFAAGDMRRGQSLIVWAISEGREAAYHVDSYLMGSSNLPRKDEGDLPRA